MVELGFVVPDELYGRTPEETVSWARRAEEAGFDAIWKGETSGTNGPMVLAMAASTTDSVRLGTGIANVYSRSPALLSMTAATLNHVSDGRAVLGLGVSSPPLVERWHGLDFERPLRRLRETIDILRATFQGERVSYDGTVFDVGPYSASYTGNAENVPIYNSAMGSTNRKLTGEFADGWTPVFTPADEFTAHRETVLDAAAAAGRNPDDIAVAPWIPVAVDEDEDVAERRVRDLLAQEVAMGYDSLLAEYGYGETASKAADQWREGDRKPAADVLADGLVEQLAVYGTPADVRDQLREYADAGADELILWSSFTASDKEIQAVLDATGLHGL